MTDLGALGMAEVAAWVQTRLRAAGVETVLSGGRCVTCWSANAYRSDDIDLIPDGFNQRSTIRTVMLGLGFSERSRYCVHPGTRVVDRVPVGLPRGRRGAPRRIADEQTSHGILRLLSPTDCVKDRLCWWFHHQHKQCLEHAVAVARETTVDIPELARWAAGEHAADAFAAIVPQLRGRKRSGTGGPKRSGDGAR